MSEYMPEKSVEKGGVEYQLDHHRDRRGVLHSSAMKILADHFPGMYYQSYERRPESRGHAGETHGDTFPECRHAESFGCRGGLSALRTKTARDNCPAVQADGFIAGVLFNIFSIGDNSIFNHSRVWMVKRFKSACDIQVPSGCHGKYRVYNKIAISDIYN